MNLFQKLYYASKRIKSNRKMGSFAVVIMAACFVMLYSSAILFEGLDYGKNTVKNSLSVPMDSCGIICFQDDFDVTRATDFLGKIYELDEIKALGNYDGGFFGELKTEGDFDYWNQILEMQHSGELEFEDDGETAYVQAVVMNSELFALQKIELITGEKLKEAEPRRWRILLGYNFREIPEGTVFKDEMNEYEVMGVMQKGTYLTDSGILNINLGGLHMAYKINMDNLILVLVPNGEQALGVCNVFGVNDEYTYEDAVSAIKRVGKEQNVRIKTGTLLARLDTVFSENKKIKSRIDIIALIICIAVFVLCITIQLLGIYMKRNELGIWLANGMSRKEIFEILWLENFIKIAVGGIIAVILERILIQLLFLKHKSVIREILSMMYGKPLLDLTVSALLLVCVISVIPVVIIAKKQATELVKGVWN